MPKGVLTITSRNYSSWSLRGWLICKGAGIDFMSCVPLWHGAAPGGDDAKQAMAELERNTPHA